MLNQEFILALHIIRSRFLCLHGDYITKKVNIRKVSKILRIILQIVKAAVKQHAKHVILIAKMSEVVRLSASILEFVNLPMIRD